MTARHAAAAGLTVLAVGWTACGGGSPRPVPRETPADPRPVTTAAAERSGATSVAVPATVQGRQRAALAARLSASVSELPWREGDHVTAGTVVVRLDDSAVRSSVTAAEAAAKAADLDLARFETLVKEGTAAARDADESRARAAAASAGLAAARENLAYAVLRAPFDGTVASRSANAGDVVSPGTTLIEIEGKGGLEARATVEADVVAQLRPGLILEALVDGQPAPLPATVRAVSASGDAATHRFEVRADLPAAPGLRSGLFARLLVPSPSSSVPRIVVPESAVFQRGGLSGVFVVTKAQARLRWVAVGGTEGGFTEVRAGLEAGERVVLEPAGLIDGQPVAEALRETR